MVWVYPPYPWYVTLLQSESHTATDPSPDHGKTSLSSGERERGREGGMENECINQRTFSNICPIRSMAGVVMGCFKSEVGNTTPTIRNRTTWNGRKHTEKATVAVANRLKCPLHAQRRGNAWQLLSMSRAQLRGTCGKLWLCVLS